MILDVMKNNYYITCIIVQNVRGNSMLIACLQQESSTNNVHWRIILCLCTLNTVTNLEW